MSDYTDYISGLGDNADIMRYISGDTDDYPDIHSKDFDPRLKKNWPAVRQAFEEKLLRDHLANPDELLR
jgi:hypothetical protein